MFWENGIKNFFGYVIRYLGEDVEKIVGFYNFRVQEEVIIISIFIIFIFKEKDYGIFTIFFSLNLFGFA